MLNKFYRLKTDDLNELTDIDSVFEFVQFRDFLDNSDGLTYLQVIGINKDGLVKTHSAFDIQFFEIEEINLERIKDLRIH